MKLRKFNAITQLQTLLIVGIVGLIIFFMICVPFYNSCKQKEVISKLKFIHTRILSANRMYSYAAGEPMDYYDLNSNSAAEFGEKYFTPYLSVATICKDSQTSCWNDVQYMDLKGNKFKDKITYSIILLNNAVLGFTKDEKTGLISMIVNIDGNAGENILGRDVFVFSFYNADYPPQLCDESVYKNKVIKSGMHFGGYDKCGIPYDTYSHNELHETCNKKAFKSEDGLGVGSSCLALIQSGSWTIDKKYPW